MGKRFQVVIIDGGLPNASFDAGSRAILDFMQLIQEAMGTHPLALHFVPMGNNPWGRDNELMALGAQIHDPTPALRSSAGQAAWLKTMQPDVVIVSRPAPASQWLQTLSSRHESEASTRFLYFGHDIHHRRFAAQLQFAPSAVLEQQHHVHRILERAIWAQYDAVIYGSLMECETVNARFPQKAVHLPLYRIGQTTPNIPMNVPQFSQPPTILWVGGAHHTPNHDAVQWLITSVLPQVESSCVLTIVGDWPIALRERIRMPSATERIQIRWLGHIDHNALMRAYAECTFVIATLRYGAGVKGKVFEALTMQCPVLTTSVGIEGLEHLDWPDRWISAPEPKAVAGRIDELLTMHPKSVFSNTLSSMLDVLQRERQQSVDRCRRLLEGRAIHELDPMFATDSAISPSG